MTYKPREDSYLIKKHIRKYAKGTVLDMGTGSGILALEAAKTAQKVIGADISIAIEKAPKNKKITFIQSDLFSNIKNKFDLIIFHPPYLPQDKGIEDKTLYGGKHGYETLVRFLINAKDYLKNNATILILFSSLTNKEIIDKSIKENLYKSKQLEEQKLDFEKLFVYELRKTALLKNLNIVKKLELFAKGKRGLVYKGEYNNKKVAIKIKAPESKAINTISHEANMLKKVNKLGIGPQLLKSEKDYLIMEFVKGEMILDFFKKAEKNQILEIINQTLQQLYKLDKVKINKQEMHHPVKHIIVQNNTPVLIDFERARYTQKPHNVTQFCQFLSSKKIVNLLEKKQIKINPAKLREFSKNYSKDKTLRLNHFYDF
ncbi:MAG: Release factor glutamine methyltransferase [Candidatus Woesearchaeota archaeon]|nr:Release factor glutamine methyltransferase [Candidatus Woesearchaeota archaeon]